jgi:hypothetical protein
MGGAMSVSEKENAVGNLGLFVVLASFAEFKSSLNNPGGNKSILIGKRKI